MIGDTASPLLELILASTLWLTASNPSKEPLLSMRQVSKAYLSVGSGFWVERCDCPACQVRKRTSRLMLADKRRYPTNRLSPGARAARNGLPSPKSAVKVQLPSVQSSQWLPKSYPDCRDAYPKHHTPHEEPNAELYPPHPA